VANTVLETVDVTFVATGHLSGFFIRSIIRDFVHNYKILCISSRACTHFDVSAQVVNMNDNLVLLPGFQKGRDIEAS
jgi:hypothetical protein